MKRKSISSLFRLFLKENRSGIICFLFFSLIILGICDIQDLKITVLGYGLILCGFFGTCVLLYRFRRFYRSYDRLYSSWTNLQYSIEELPAADTCLEEMYRCMLMEVFESRAVLYSKMKREAADTEDYYTLWTHQIKTPIAALRLILQSQNTADKKLYMEQELFEIEQYAEMALHYLRLHNMENDFLFQEYDLYEITSHALKKYSIQFIEKRLSLQFEEFAYSFVTDEKWLEFVIGQIISNAVKYTKQGGVNIRFENENTPILRIFDTGIGISKTDLPRIFEKGFTGYNGHMDKRSTGIGLYLCKQVTDRLKIRLEVESEIGKGTCFSLHFPKQDA